jgi:thioredoxin reductase
MDFTGKVAISTGAASGMGLLFSQNWAELGGNVVLDVINDVKQSIINLINEDPNGFVLSGCNWNSTIPQIFYNKAIELARGTPTTNIDLSGEDLKDKFQEHLDNMEIQITYKKVNNIYAMGEYFALMSGDEMFEATTVILATGVEYGKPIKGEEEFLGRGVGYCATCDAPLYRDKKVAIIGYNEESEEEANFLNEIA